MLNNDTAYPLYAQIADQLRLNIQTEKWKESQRIPTEMELCEYYHVSRITVRKAIDELVRENLLYRERAKGTFVKAMTLNKDEYATIVKGFTQELQEQGKNAMTVFAEVEHSHADQRLAKFLNIKVGEEILILKRVRGDGNDVFAYFKTYLAYKKEYSLKSRDYYGSFYDYLRSLGIVVNQEREYIEAVSATKELKKLLKVKESDPILKRVRFTSQKTEDFYEYTECFYVGSKYRFYLDFDN
ncbi:GntR family transcriptional regulator [Lederbergia lenta]|uniref:GntR family transcriptional regulator n=1 Tax=Lederbergia lenta TaxID=1467 RepID=A0A2X4W2T5_LEDLE|nr:GntR family transcriptional regulator [Lederbergia lenta]MCM3109597.1 GntR family transcriptional regulator [Lederbergia lenta]MEC2324648.1 GntR family transcriptional regulator [Lederbergia lenta]SQI58907.1 GntR family transcriptional regulator [Lederbergia lenta]